jgi:hypothetical protein
MSPKGATRIYSPRYFACDSAEKEIPGRTMRAKNLQIRHALEIKLIDLSRSRENERRMSPSCVTRCWMIQQ